ncbi:nucleotide pyrophosphohydrolase [Marinibactrum halimedae]|uniref:Nucleotide pyrophosphohydrolase n=1 Tax=Marinibactrum halimedae TaxID=1444977 RepID=A0AA37TA66_9GAMM|nr:nucleotide pyrophosphohydrolase [Marinibactrum halimedae]MCD9458021.1 nucleotide pyrophosphohydrolase [Marinibactrum halimedae]GLS27647.1 nucleotide pyrophosphohydrolase [Marinibactrum halimedae]
MKEMLSIEDITEYLRVFSKEREWDQFHSPKNLSMSVAIEAAELMEHFQWLSLEASANLSEEVKAEVSDEMADVLLYLVRLADVLGINLLRSVNVKAGKNEKKYPAEAVKGSLKKYQEFRRNYK